MKTDFKTISIIILVLVLGIVGGLFGGKYFQRSEVPASAQVLQEYKDDVAKVIRTNAKDLQTCYNDHLSGNPKIREGKISFIFQVEEDGKVSSTDIIGNEFESEEIKKCVSTKISSYRFPPPPIGVNRYISHTLRFESPESFAERRKKRFPKVLPTSPE